MISSTKSDCGTWAYESTYDNDRDYPWVEYGVTTYGPVRDLANGNRGDLWPKRSGEVVLKCSTGHPRTTWAYDRKAAMASLRLEGIKGKDAVDGVDTEIAYLESWLNGETYYVHLTVEHLPSGITEHLGSVEADDSATSDDYVQSVLSGLQHEIELSTEYQAFIGDEATASN